MHCRVRSTTPRRQGTGLAHARASRQAEEAHAAHASALHGLADSMRTFLSEAALPVVQDPNEAGALTLLPALYRVLNAMHPGFVDLEAAL